MLNNRGAFLSKLTCSPFLDAIAPTEMEEELHEKLIELFPNPAEQKTVFSIAESILGGIRFVEGFQLSAVAREIAVACYHMLKDQEPYRFADDDLVKRKYKRLEKIGSPALCAG